MVLGTPIVLNLVPSGARAVAHVNEVDQGAELQFAIYNGNTAYNVPEGVTATIRGTKGDGFGYTAAAAVTVGSNIITVTLDEQMTAVAGVNNVFELVLANSNGFRAGTSNFILDVERAALNENTVVSDSDLAYAEQVLNDLQSVQAVNTQVQQNKAGLAAEISNRQTAVSAEASARQAADNTLQSNINAEASARATEDASLQSQINQLIAPSGSAPSAAEVENARIGSDGTVYPTLGDAIRTQNSLLKSQIDTSARYGDYLYVAIENGSFSSSGLTTGATNRIRTNLIPFKTGDKIFIENGSLQHACGIWEGGVSSSSIRRNDDNFSSSDETINCTYDGYIVVVFRFSNNANISPSDFDGLVKNNYRTFLTEEFSKKLDKESPNLISSQLNRLYPVSGVTTGTYLTMSTKDGQPIGLNPDQTNIEFYDSNKNFIDRYGFPSSASSRTIGPLSETFSDTAYIAIAHCAPRVPIMLNKGQSALPYEPYYDPIDKISDDLYAVSKEVENITNVKDHEHDLAIVDALDHHVNGNGNPTKNALTLLWCTDIHAEAERTQRMIDLINSWSDTLDIAINTGDTTDKLQTDGLTWYDSIVSQSDIPILNTVGNHDAWTDLYGTLASQSAVYNMVIAPVAAQTEIVQPQDASTDGLCYYYKDVNGIRIIVLDCMYWNSAELTWFASVLDSAVQSSKPVIACVHYPFANTYRTLLDSIWNTGVLNNSGNVVPIDAAEAVQTFITSGGTFLCWLQGHSHADRIVDLESYGHQLCLQATSFTNRETLVYKVPDVRAYNYDALTVLTVDTTDKILKVYRIGANINGSGQKYNLFAYNYDNHSIVCDW